MGKLAKIYKPEESEQMCAPTDHCIKWECKKATLVKVGKFWCCPRCGSSYGEHPNPRMK